MKKFIILILISAFIFMMGYIAGIQLINYIFKGVI